MIVRKLKCKMCGANKVNEVSTGYMYCDYCASFMGYDFEKVEEESVNIFDYTYFQKHGQWPPGVQEYMDTLQVLGAAITASDGAQYNEAALKMQELEMTLFPKRFSPKVKQAEYRNRFLTYYRAYLEDRMKDNFFEEQKATQEKFTALQSGVTTKMVDYKPVWVYDEKLEIYFDEVKAFCMESAEKIMAYPSVSLYPETTDDTTIDTIFKQSINAYTSILDKEGFSKVIEYLGMKTEYIEIADVATTDQDCFGCGAHIKVPEGSKKMVCEYCGGTNNIEQGGINCLNCSTTFLPDESTDKNSCPACGAIVRVMNL